MLKRISASSGAAAIALALLCLTPPHAIAQQGFTPCPAQQYPGLTFGPNVPSYSVGMIGGQCYCGVWTNVTPQQAVELGWYASCNNGRGICNYAPGTRASNAVCKPQ